jgi:hypothetical protein
MKSQAFQWARLRVSQMDGTSAFRAASLQPRSTERSKIRLLTWSRCAANAGVKLHSSAVGTQLYVANTDIENCLK